jgi:taurine dioxygenase
MNTETEPVDLSIAPLSDAMGVVINGVDLAGGISGAELETIKKHWYERCIVLFRGQSLTEEQQVVFGEKFGELAHTLKKFEITKNPAIMYVTNEKRDGQYQGALPDGEMYFHMDMCYLERPSMASILYAINIPKNGGDTLFANMYKAYEDLDEETKSFIEQRMAINSYDPGKSDYASTRSTSDYRSETELSYPQPMVYRHPVTGRKALYVNRVMTRQVEGLAETESNALLQRLFAHQEQEKYISATNGSREMC